MVRGVVGEVLVEPGDGSQGALRIGPDSGAADRKHAPVRIVVIDAVVDLAAAQQRDSPLAAHRVGHVLQPGGHCQLAGRFQEGDGSCHVAVPHREVGEAPSQSDDFGVVVGRLGSGQLVGAPIDEAGIENLVAAARQPCGELGQVHDPWPDPAAAHRDIVGIGRTAVAADHDRDAGGCGERSQTRAWQARERRPCHPPQPGDHAQGLSRCDQGADGGAVDVAIFAEQQTQRPAVEQ